MYFPVGLTKEGYPPYTLYITVVQNELSKIIGERKGIQWFPN